MAKAPYIPRSIRSVELRTPRLPHEPAYQEIPQQEGGHSCPPPDDLEATRVPAGPHKGKTLLQLLNDHPGYLLHLREEAFTNDEAFELKVEEFCQKYQHRLERATGGSAASTLWAAAICANEIAQPGAGAIVQIVANCREAILVEATFLEEAQNKAFNACLARWPFGKYCSHAAAVINIPLGQLRRALKAEQPANSRR